jgi:tetratricopeptide (TPR) repeat protein
MTSQARQALARDPADSEAALMLATCLFAQRIFAVDFDGADAQAYETAGDEIERLVLAALSRGCHEPLLRLAAARLLFGLHRGHLPFVRQFLADTLTSSAAFAAGLSLAGLIKMHLGDLRGAIANYDQALALCEPATEFEVYLQRRKAEALIADGDRPAALTCLDRALGVKPQDALLHVLRLDAERAPDRIAADAMASWTAPVARQVMGRLMFGVARNFSRPEHADAVLAGPMRRLVERFGPQALPTAAPGA